MNTLSKSVFAVTALVLSQLALPAWAAKEDATVRLTAETPKSDLNIKLVDGEITIESSAGNEVVLEASGRLDRSETKELITLKKSGNDVTFKQEENTDLKTVKIQIPTSFKGEIAIKTVSGNLQLKQIAAKELEVETVSGAVAGEVTTPEIKVKSVSGKVDLKNSMAAETKVKTVSGAVNLKMAAGGKYKIRMKSVSGNAESRLGSDSKAKQEVSVQTVSGDIVVE
ncbi:hypothetical protein D3C72_838740 [compost metagenome]